MKQIKKVIARAKKIVRNLYFFWQGFKALPLLFPKKFSMVKKKYMESPLITGEKIQKICDLYLGEIFYNPLIKFDGKSLSLHSIKYPIDNPSLIFCYGDCLPLLAERLHLFIHPFVLVTHNSDYDIIPDTITETLLHSEKILKWFGQNTLLCHPKLETLPIGLANMMWQPNGYIFNESSFINNSDKKSKNIFFNFKINTYPQERQRCYDKLKNKIPFLKTVDFPDYLLELKEYAFCICPRGNGIDTHRFWECLYVKTVPIVVKSPFVECLRRHQVPMVILNDWEELIPEKLNYHEYDFTHPQFQRYLDFHNYEYWFHEPLSKNNDYRTK